MNNHNFVDWELPQSLFEISPLWTWEDLRVYLVERKIAVSITRKTKKSGFECYRVTVEEVENGRYAIVSIDDYGSYEEARAKGYRNALALL